MSADQLFYYEQKSATGWTPVTVPTLPQTVQVGGALRIKRAGGIGPRVRFDPVLVGPGHHALTLDQLAQIYGAGGDQPATAAGRA